ncbi:MAG: hypothetical protein K1X36_07745 [Pyrinomonadaceae bacterium]|nr:hypothetical protein [Pyrinomonadaceae bacterium]
MENVEKLKNARNLLLKLHKVMIDFERELHEAVHGPLTAGQFLNVLIENEDFAWLRKFSMLIVEIDEMFDLKDGITSDLVDANLAKISELVEMREEDEYFRAKYRNVVQQHSDAASLQSELRSMFG